MQANSIKHRIQLLKEVVGGNRRELSRILGVSDVTIMGWEGSSEPTPRLLRQIAERTGLSFEWLKNGGDDDEEIAKFCARLNGTETARLQESAPVNSLPLNTSSESRAVAILSGQLDPVGISEAITTMLRDEKLPRRDRIQIAEQLTSTLLDRLRRENIVKYNS